MVTPSETRAVTEAKASAHGKPAGKPAGQPQRAASPWAPSLGATAQLFTAFDSPRRFGECDCEVLLVCSQGESGGK